MSRVESSRRTVAELVLARLREEVRAERAYHLEAHPAPVKLDQNENSFGLPPEIEEAVGDALKRVALNRYPNVVATPLKEALGRLNDWPADGVLVGNGSNELLQMLAISTLDRGRTAVAPSPSFAVYGYLSRLQGAELVEVPLDDDFQYDLEPLIRAVDEKQPALTFLCCPNNPTGSSLTSEQVERIARRNQGILVVDEAYFEFGGSVARELLPRYPHMAVSRTFSKAMSLAGCRVGYLLTHPELAAEIGKAQLPYALNGVSRSVALSVCKHYALIQAQARAIVKERDSLHRRLEELEGIRSYPSAGNFILFDCAAGARPVFDGLLSRGVLVRDLSSRPRLTRSLRVTVGRPDENERFLAALRETLEALP
jgi:histidinol-phosphate aminotransferase